MVTALIAEFNPFHNGHKYILEKIKQRSECAVVIMSGNFVQRGDTAITDKHTRARIALENGADLVIELPVIYALNTAREFARGAVLTLNAMGVIDSLAFGSESGDISELENAARLLDNEPEEVSERIRVLMASGMSYPSAREKAYEGHITKNILASPNNILAVEYLRALRRSESNITPFTVERTNDFHSLSTEGDIISATAVRALIENNENASDYVPDNRFDIYGISELDTAITYFLRTSSPEELARINDISEGLENRIIRAAQGESGFIKIAEAAKSKRYTMSRIRRVILGAFLGLTKELCAEPPSYIRVLGMNENGRALLKRMKKTAELPVITKTASFKADKIFKAEIRATEAAALCRRGGSAAANREYIVSPIIL